MNGYFFGVAFFDFQKRAGEASPIHPGYAHMNIAEYASVRVHSQPRNQRNQGIIREFENGPFFSKKSGNYQGVLIDYQGNQVKLTLS